MTQVILGTFVGYITVGIIIFFGVIGFLIGIGKASFFIAPRDNWAKSPADMSSEKVKIGCIVSIVFMIIIGWLIVKIFG